MKTRIIHTAMLWLLLISMLLIPAAGAAADEGIMVDDTGTAQQLVEALLGGGISVSNVSYKGSPLASGTFTGGTAIIGFEDGIILSSGLAAYVTGPNNNDYGGTNLRLDGDPDLDVLAKSSTYDATVLEFDFVPEGSTVTFEYVFGSEEYNEYVNSPFNDTFGFFVNGINRALLPDGSTVVSINNVNGGNPYGIRSSNSAYYRNNDISDGGGAIATQLDGLTVVLSLTASVAKGVTNHIKLAIADTSDNLLDSGVFIRAGSFTSIPNLYLEPATATGQTGASHTVTAIASLNGVPQTGLNIGFEVTGGPNSGETGSGTTDAQGKASWSYAGEGGEGTDTIQAAATIGGSLETSNHVYRVWEMPSNAPPTADAGPDQTVEANTAGGALVELDGSGSADDGNLLPLVYSWSWTEAGITKTASGVTATVKLPLGETVITLEVADGEFRDTSEVIIVVQDTTEPALTISCGEGVNPHGNMVPGENRDNNNGEAKKNVNPDGFYALQAVATDYSGADLYIGTSESPYLLKITSGEPMQIRFTESAATAAEIKKIGSNGSKGRAVTVMYHIMLPGAPVITAVDANGNTTDPCPVFPVAPPKEPGS